MDLLGKVAIGAGIGYLAYRFLAPPSGPPAFVPGPAGAMPEAPPPTYVVPSVRSTGTTGTTGTRRVVIPSRTAGASPSPSFGAGTTVSGRTPGARIVIPGRTL